ncbi:hypothetical protein GW17_00052649 [Ensete ventricosum]|nr:hypothetical protein GW17_00052649 [Ensete ventricosum]
MSSQAGDVRASSQLCDQESVSFGRTTSASSLSSSRSPLLRAGATLPSLAVRTIELQGQRGFMFGFLRLDLAFFYL